MTKSTTLPLAALFQFLAMLFPAAAEHIYIAQTARGTNTGADAANAHGYTWFNDRTNWNSSTAADGKIGPGDTVHLTGTINNQLTIIGSGTTSNRITIKFDPGAKISAPSWTGTGAIYGDEISDITIEGGNPGPVKTTFTQVDMEATQNGTALPLQVDGSRFIFIENAGSNITIRNLWMTGLYVRTYQHPSDTHATASAISLRGQDDLVIENCAIFHAETGLTIVGNGDLNERLIIRDCLASDCSNGIKMGVAGENHINKDCQIIRNRIDHMARWGGIETGGFHGDGIQTITVSAGQRQDNLTVAYNHIGPNVGRPGDLTALIFLEDFINGCKVYNNLLEYAPGHHSSNPAITAATHPNFIGTSFGLPTLIANNTIKGGATSGAIATAFAIVQGNVAAGMGSYISVYREPGNELTIDKNVFFGATNDEFGVTGNGQGIYRTPRWQELFGYDKNSIFADPKLNANGTLQSGSPAIGLAPAQSAFNDDFNRNVRTGAWDAGAFEFGSSGGGGSAPTPTPVSSPSPTPVSSPTPTPTATPSPGSTPVPLGANVALAANGGVASASSTFSSNYAVNGVNNGDRTGAGWAVGSGGWNDATEQTYPDEVEIAFSGPKTINEIDVFTLQDHPGEPPTESMTFADHGITDFDVQSWNGSAWINVPGGQIRGNNRVWRKLTFAPINTTKIRVVVNKALGAYSRIVEIEADTSSALPAQTTIATATPTPSPTPASSTFSVSFPADSEQPTLPFAVTDGYISQPSGTSLANGGRVSYEFTVPEHGEYAVVLDVDAPDTGENSLYLNIDAEPEDPIMIWDIPVTSGFQTRVASWRGGGTVDNNQFVPRYFLLSPGQHQLIIRGREGNTKFRTITIVKRPPPPNDLVIPQ